MPKTVLITGSTDGIGLATAKQLLELGHHVIIHGRDANKINHAKSQLKALYPSASITSFQADFSRLSDVEALANSLKQQQTHIDVLINNAGVFKAPNHRSYDGYDLRFAVNTLAPYLLTHLLLPIMKPGGRVINLSSAAQAPIQLDALLNARDISESEAYAQSKLALTAWSRHLGTPNNITQSEISFIAINPGSFLGSKMVKDAYGMSGGDINIGADILASAALSDEFKDASGKYFDNDTGQFSAPHPSINHPETIEQLMATLEQITQPYLSR